MRSIFGKIQKNLKIPLVNYVFSAITIILGGFILFNIAFIFAWLVSLIVRMPLQLFLQNDIDMNYSWLPILQHLTYLLIILIISLPILKSKRLPILAKATYFTVPAIVTYVTLGILFNQTFYISIVLSAIVTLLAFLFLYLKKLPWQYWFAFFYVVILVLCIVIFNIEI